jgi:hypothetical protein
MEPASPADRTSRLSRWRPGAEVASALRLSDLAPRDRHMALLKTVTTVLVSCGLIVGAYYVLPMNRESAVRGTLRVGAVIALVGAALAWQVRRISKAALPELRAAEALGVIVALFLCGFSAIYLSMSHEAASTFTQSLDHTRALYFTISVFSTVGFGDITPKTDAARLIVSTQMLLDLAIIGVVVRLLFNAARSRTAANTASASSSDDA